MPLDWIPLGSFVSALVTSQLVGRLNGSVFNNLGNSVGSSYEISLSPVSLLRNWTHYLVDGYNDSALLLLVCLCVCVWLSYPKLGKRSVLVATLVAGSMAWVPNSMLPNHYLPGYSFTGAMFLFSPLLLVFHFTFGTHSKIISALSNRQLRLLGAFMVASMSISSLITNEIYSKNAWALQQETIQTNLLVSLGKLFEGLPKTDETVRVLVTGFTSPFSPFECGLSLVSIGAPRNLVFEVVDYRRLALSVKEASVNVKYVDPSNLNITGISEIWIYRSDGTLIKRMEAGDYPKFSKIKVGSSEMNYIAYPALLDIFGQNSVQASDDSGLKFLRCGIEMIQYKNLKVLAAALILVA